MSRLVRSWETMMRDEREDIGRLAADMVLTVREYAKAEKANAGTSQGTAALERRLIDLAEAFYATEELYAMEVCFAPRGKAASLAQPRRRPSGWQARKIHSLIAKFFASVAQTTKDSVRANAGADALAPFTGPAFRGLCRALDEAGYLKTPAV